MRKYWLSFYLLVKRKHVLCVSIFCGAVYPACRVVVCSVVAGFVLTKNLPDDGLRFETYVGVQTFYKRYNKKWFLICNS
jgi:hypothetical protein